MMATTKKTDEAEAAPAGEPAEEAPKAAAAAKPTTKKKTKKKTTKKPARNKFLAATRAFIQKKTGHKPVKEFLGQRPHIGSGCFAIDDLIGGAPAIDGSGPKCPGFPRRAMTEVYGAESSGKTTGALQAIAECQKNGGVAMFLDFEHALDHGYAKALGVSFNEERLLLYEPQTFEEGLKMIYGGLKGGVDLIVVDSVAAMVPKAAMEKSLDKEATIGLTARYLSYNLPKIVNWLNNPDRTSNPKGTAIVWINQTRAKIGGSGKGADHTTPGGWALKFFVWLRLMYTRIGSEYVERKDKLTGKKKRYPYGNHTIVKVVKNKMDGKQGHATSIFIRYGQGIDEAYSLIAAAVANKLVQKNGGWYVLGEERFNGREALRKFLQENPKAFAALRTKILSIIQATAEEMAEELSEEDEIRAAFESGFDEEFGEEDDEEEHILDEDDTDGEIDEDSALGDDD